MKQLGWAIMFIASETLAGARCPPLDGLYKDRSDGSMLRIAIERCSRITVAHSIGGTWTLPIGGPFEPFLPPRPSLQDGSRMYQARVHVEGEQLVSEFDVRQAGKRLWREVTTYGLDSRGDLLVQDQFFEGEPLRLKRFINREFARR